MALIRPYNAADLAAVRNVWVEIGWLEASDSAEALGWCLGQGQTLVAEVDGQPEVSINGVLGTIHHTGSEVPLWGVLSLTTSRVARRQHLGSALVARSIVHGREQGALATILGVFDHGYYDRFGFGAGSYELGSTIDPGSLRVSPPDKQLRRLGAHDHEEIFASFQRRMRSHGTVVLQNSAEWRAAFVYDQGTTGYGFETDGLLTHYFLAIPGGDKPLTITEMVYESRQQLLELLGVIASFADQTTAVRIRNDPAVLEVEDLLDRPIRHRNATRTAASPLRTDANRWWQLRLNRIPEALQILEAHGSVEFGLSVTDPIEQHLPDDGQWHGESGTYRVTLGQSTECDVGDISDLPTVTCSVNALSRWWLGVANASALAATDDFSGPDDLLRALDAALVLPHPHVGTNF